MIVNCTITIVDHFDDNIKLLYYRSALISCGLKSGVLVILSIMNTGNGLLMKYIAHVPSKEYQFL